MAQVETQNRKYKICLIGDGGVGKTTYINRVLDGSFLKTYNATVGAAVHSVTFMVSEQHSITFEVWDTAGQEKNAGLKDLYYIDADAAIFFFDVTSRITASNLLLWIKNFQRVSGESRPIVVCANKIDVKDKKVNKKQILSLLKDYNFEYCEISAKTNHNFVQPFLALARHLTMNRELIFVSNINLAPSGLNYDQEPSFNQDLYSDLQKARDLAPEEF